MRELLANPGYREHLAARAVPQPVLVGYSQAGRDSGYLAHAHWRCIDAQRDLAQSLSAAGAAGVSSTTRAAAAWRAAARAWMP